jgi:thioredoxin reductase
MPKQTAVEWLNECLSIHLTHEQQMQVEGLFQQSKAMEKEQIVKALNDGWNMAKQAEQYYNETYGGQDV